MSLFDQMLARYNVQEDGIKNATYEVMQEIILAGLYRGGFFNKAAFYGGTCLRIFHGMNRFSEDMDFSLIAPVLLYDTLFCFTRSVRRENARPGFQEMEAACKRARLVRF
jgi:hypothetical protein